LINKINFLILFIIFKGFGVIWKGGEPNFINNYYHNNSAIFGSEKTSEPFKIAFKITSFKNNSEIYNSITNLESFSFKNITVGK